mmetsp:Transcript_107016/g.301075  ORF Transcript_107016/g.301075 Transcript_107016/m.301075 type:complete len:212 (-) Transcript_107016:39-674(-)
MAERAPNKPIELFHDLQRWFATQVNEIDAMKSRHERLNSRQKDALTAMMAQMQKDTAQRKSEMNEFSLDLEQYTLRKFDLLTDDIKSAYVETEDSAKVDFRMAGGDRFHRRARQIRNVTNRIDSLHVSLNGVASAWRTFIDGHCQVEPAEALDQPKEDVLQKDARMEALRSHALEEDQRFLENISGVIPGCADSGASSSGRPTALGGRPQT